MDLLGSPPFAFARRTAWDRSQNELSAAIQQANESGRQLLDLTNSNPQSCGFHFEAAAILAPLLRPDALAYRPEPQGLLSAREAVARYYAEHHADVSPEAIVLTASTSEAYSHLFRLLCDPGDEILAATPSYPLFNYLAELSDVVLRSYPLFHDQGWWIDFAELERRITSRTRAIIVVHPNNPTGHTTSRIERDRLEQLCLRHNLALIVDEVFLDYSLDAATPVQTFAGQDLPVLTFVVSGLSKIAALPQMKVGWIAITGPQPVREEARARLEIIADTFLSVNAPAQLALPLWLEQAHRIQEQILVRIRENLEILQTAKLDAPAPEAGWSTLLRLPRTFHQADASTALLGLGLLAHPAHFYGLSDRGRVVLSLIVPSTIMAASAQRIGLAFRVR